MSETFTPSVSGRIFSREELKGVPMSQRISIDDIDELSSLSRLIDEFLSPANAPHRERPRKPRRQTSNPAIAANYPRIMALRRYLDSIDARAEAIVPGLSRTQHDEFVDGVELAILRLDAQMTAKQMAARLGVTHQAVTNNYEQSGPVTTHAVEVYLAVLPVAEFP